MDDNATCHRTLAVQDCLDSEGIQRLVLPARSPDLNPIENVWDALGWQVAGRNYPPTNKKTLIRALTEEWDKLPQQLLDNVVQRHIGRYVRRPVRGVPLTATHCHLILTWSRKYALWIPQQRSCVMFSDESRFSLQFDSRRSLIWRAPGTRYYQEKTIKRHRYVGAGCLVWGGIILGSRTDLHVQSVTMTGHIYRDVILEQHVRLFRGAMGAEFLFMDDNARPDRANIADECLQSEDITRIN
ncbi:transposable element Tcb1 transposase [Trichonephila clavipes]|nr:transposable element Tcb1 transposase [Trichonephila clavipes]